MQEESGEASLVKMVVSGQGKGDVLFTHHYERDTTA